jgi:SWI/SNF-related matrix-associated actin-dependent regulator of chromatin subfamily A-like protein 1
VSELTLSATLAHDEAVLRFPYDDRLRQLLRAIPGRRWDPVERVWCVPLGPDQAEALSRLLAGLPCAPQVSDALARTLERRRARRDRRECHVDLSRPDERWWLSFATDGAREPVAALMEHPHMREVPAIGRALVPLDEHAGELVCELARQHDSVRLSNAARRALEELAARVAGQRQRAAAPPSRAVKRIENVESLPDRRPRPAAVLELSRVHLEPTFVLVRGADPACLRDFAALGGAVRSALRADPFCVPQLDEFLAEREVWVAPDALELLQEIREQHALAAGLVQRSAATDAPLHVSGLGGELKPFQRAGVSYLLERRRAFLADEQGLGKTIEAIATLHAAGAYPSVVVCPASLKLNWLRELERWLPGRSVRALAGNRCAERISTADVTVVNYDIVAARLRELCALGARALVLDESHYCKNAAAKRTQAVARLAASVPRDGLVLALSGTPVTNRPAELISQLRILGRLEDFGSGVRFGERFRGPDAHLRLHWHLRARCFVRRLKADVLPQLPAKTRAVVPVELDNEAEYRLAERDLVAWLRSQPLDLRELDAKVAAALRAERLVRCNALKSLAARGKLRAALAWIHDFCSSGERLVVFARHREIQRAVLARFPEALHILGEDSPAARDGALLAFQQQREDERAPRLIVCSIDVAGHGLTLTRASNVAFLELDWTPAKHDQAEDRCHRIGQQDAVNAYYLLAADTIDETIATLLERKRAVIGAVTDGHEQDDQGVLDALVRELRGAPYRHLRAVA